MSYLSHLTEQPLQAIGDSDNSTEYGINSIHSRGGSVSTPWAADPESRQWAEFGQEGVDGAIRGMQDASAPLKLDLGEELK